MNGKVIPKEQLTAYQRWELGGLESGQNPSVQAAPEPERQEEAVAVALPTAEQLERIHQQAWQEGYRLGREEGYKAGYETGAQDARVYLERLRLLAEAMDADRLRQDEQLAREVLELAMNIAQQVVRTSLKVKPTLIMAVVREAIANLPALTGHTRLVVHPQHAPFVRECLSNEYAHLAWKVVEDPSLEPGGFRVENAHGEMDASMEVRWRDIVTALGADASWLD
ncbi:MAG: flagellar assembly protein FliH [Thiobacillaceae bacterium]